MELREGTKGKGKGEGAREGDGRAEGARGKLSAEK